MSFVFGAISYMVKFKWNQNEKLQISTLTITYQDLLSPLKVASNMPSGTLEKFTLLFSSRIKKKKNKSHLGCPESGTKIYLVKVLNRVLTFGFYESLSSRNLGGMMSKKCLFET